MNTELCATEGWGNFLQKIRLATSEAVFVMFDANATEPLASLLGARDASVGKEAGEASSNTSLVGNSQRLLEVVDLTRRYAPHEITVLITGETGTGKELLAKCIHDNSPRKDGPFVACNLAAVPETLVESELFGYKKGAFTGADKDKKGFLAEAEGGTLFLDEIGDLPHTLQVKLLRLLENHEYFRIGDPTPKTANVRIVTATNKDLDQAIVDNAFRSDLYYRLNSARIMLPPLRERRDDVLLLTEHFIEQTCQRIQRPLKKISSSINALLANYPWPGNIRELKNVVESAVMVSNSEFLVMGDLPMHLQQHAIENRDEISTNAVTKLDNAEKQMIEESLQATKGNKAAAAKSLGISTRTLYRKLEKYGFAAAA